jgi:hypothetical protein
MYYLSLVITIILILFIVSSMICQIYECYAEDDPMIINLKTEIDNFLLLNNFNEEELQKLKKAFQMIKIYRGDKSYTINKQKIYLCLKDENGNYYDKNMLMYVLLHELSHCVCDEIGHTEKFEDIFTKILYNATKCGIYDPSKPIIQNYCKF